MFPLCLPNLCEETVKICPDRNEGSVDVSYLILKSTWLKYPFIPLTSHKIDLPMNKGNGIDQLTLSIMCSVVDWDPVTLLILIQSITGIYRIKNSQQDRLVRMVKPLYRD